MDTVARIGGDEFIILLADIQNDSNSATIAQNIIDKLNLDFKISNTTLNIGASIGISSFPKDGDNIDTIVSAADEAMYKAKESGKNNFAFYNKI